MSPSELQAFMTRRGIYADYVKACARYEIAMLPLLEAACMATQACEASNLQKMDGPARLSTGVGFMQTLTYDALHHPASLAGDELPKLFR